MKKLCPIALLLLFSVLACALCAARITGDQVMAAVKARFDPIKDYKTDITVNLKGPGVSVNNMKMTLYFKRPNKVHVEAKEGAGLVPPGNYFGNPIDELAKNRKATYLKSERKNGLDSYAIRLDSTQEASNARTVLVWVDKARGVIVAVESPEHGFQSDWTYTRIEGKYFLPMQITAEMDAPSQSGKPQKATTTIKFSNYQINRGISDRIFEQKPVRR